MGMAYFGGDHNGRHYSTLVDNFDLYRRRTSGKPYFYIQGICDDECDPLEPEKAPEHGYHLVFRTADNTLVSVVRMPSENPFGPYDEKEVFHLKIHFQQHDKTINNAAAPQGTVVTKTRKETTI